MKHSRSAGGIRGEPSATERDRRRAKPKRSGVSSGRIALVVAVVGLVLIVLFILPRGGQRSDAPLPRAGFSTGTPLNSVDPTSGKPVVAGITSTYKGYTIGHCCEPSRQEWEALSVERKEAILRRMLK